MAWRPITLIFTLFFTLLLPALTSGSLVSRNNATRSYSGPAPIGRSHPPVWSRKSHNQLFGSRAIPSLPSGWSQRACYYDSSSSRALVGYSALGISNLTPNSCIDTCANLGFAFSGTEFGGECYCGNVLTSTASIAPTSDCSQPCSGDASQTCGNGDRIQVYSFTSTSTWTRLGCYTDSSTRTLSGYSTTSQANTPVSCEGTCAAKGFAYAGVEYGGECYCGNAIASGANYGQIAAASDCSMACTGDSTQACGGSYRVVIYKNTASSTTSVAPTSTSTPTTWSSVGCYVDSSVRVLAAYSPSIELITPTTCEAACASFSYKYAGVEYGQECYCANWISSGAQLASSNSECGMSCSGDPSQTCGGNYRIAIYMAPPITGTAPPSTTLTATSTAATTTATSTSLWSPLGCYTDDTNNRALLGSEVTSTSSQTPAACQATCSLQGYTYAGVEYGGECYCSNTIRTAVSPSTGRVALASDCNVPCTGDATITCGGSYRIAIYSLGTTAAFTTSATSGASTSTAVSTSTGITTTTSTGTGTGTSTGPGTSTSTSISTTMTTTTIPVTSTSSVVVTTPTPTPTSSGRIVTAHFMVGNTYSYDQSTWLYNINAAVAGGIDGFALNVGVDWWQPARVSDAYAAALASGTGFKLFLSFDVTSLPCAGSGDAAIIRTYLNTYASHPNQYFYQSKQFASTFGGENCRFGQGDINSAWNYAVRTGVTNQVAFVPAFFSDPSTFGSTTAMDGEFNWNGGWPSGDFDTSFDTDNNYISNLGGRYYIAPVTPVFFTHYGANSYNKNWIYRSDDWLYSTRWELLIRNRDRIDLVEIISWNDYGESHYIGPIGVDQPNSQAWVDGFDHQGWTTMTKYYATAWKTGSYPTITKDQIFLSSRPHSRDAVIDDPVGKPSNWQWTDDYLWAVVFATSPSTLTLSIGSSSSVTAITPGANKIKLALSPGSPRAILVNSVTDVTIIDFSPSGFVYSRTASAYNFNEYMAASP